MFTNINALAHSETFANAAEQMLLKCSTLSSLYVIKMCLLPIERLYSWNQY